MTDPEIDAILTRLRDTAMELEPHAVRLRQEHKFEMAVHLTALEVTVKDAVRRFYQDQGLAAERR